MFQWKENPSSTNNKYFKIWESKYIDSSEFEDIENYKNPLFAKSVQSKVFHTKKFTVSNFKFDLSLVFCSFVQIWYSTQHSISFIYFYF